MLVGAPMGHRGSHRQQAFRGEGLTTGIVTCNPADAAHFLVPHAGHTRPHPSSLSPDPEATQFQLTRLEDVMGMLTCRISILPLLIARLAPRTSTGAEEGLWRRSSSPITSFPLERMDGDLYKSVGLVSPPEKSSNRGSERIPSQTRRRASCRPPVDHRCPPARYR